MKKVTIYISMQDLQDILEDYINTNLLKEPAKIIEMRETNYSSVDGFFITITQKETETK